MRRVFGLFARFSGVSGRPPARDPWRSLLGTPVVLVGHPGSGFCAHIARIARLTPCLVGCDHDIFGGLLRPAVVRVDPTLTTCCVLGSYLQWYRDPRGPPLYSGLGDCPNNLILPLPSPKRFARIYEQRSSLIHPSTWNVTSANYFAYVGFNALRLCRVLLTRRSSHGPGCVLRPVGRLISEVILPL